MKSDSKKRDEVLVVAMAVVLLGTAGARAAPSNPPHGSDLVFEPNAGQWPDAVRAVVRSGPASWWLEDDGWMLDLHEPVAGADGEPDRWRGAAVRMRFRDPDGGTFRTERRTGGWHNDLRGNDPSRWVAGIPLWSGARWAELYDGVDVVARSRDGHFEYDLLLQPGADLSRVEIVCEGADGLALLGDGSLAVETPLGSVVQPPPLTWQVQADGSRRPVVCAYELRGPDRFGFAAPGADPDRPLVVDPTLTWSSFVGGASTDWAFDVVTDEAGRTTLAGFTNTTAYPVTPGAWDESFNGTRDGFVTRLAADGGGLVFSTVLGGSAMDEIRGLCLDEGGGVVVTGFTASSNFPTSGGAYQTTYQGGSGLLASDLFVTCLDETGGLLLLSTYVGGTGDDVGIDAAVGADASIYVAAWSASSDFPVTAGAFDTSYNGGNAVGDSVVLRLEPDGTGLRWASFLGGDDDDVVNDILVDANGNAVVAGWTNSGDFPTTAGAWQTAPGGFSDGFVGAVSADGASLVASTRLGGSGDDNLRSIDRDDDGRLLVAGNSTSADFPITANAVQATAAGGFWEGDLVLARLSGDVDALDFATYLGGSGDDAAEVVRVLEGGLVAVAGSTTSSGFPVTADALDSTLGGALDAVFAVIDVDDGVLATSSLLGGEFSDKILGLGMLPSGELGLGGWTQSATFPVTAGAFDESFDGVPGWTQQAFAAHVDTGLSLAASTTWTDLGYATGGAWGEPVLEVEGSLGPGGSGTIALSGAAPYKAGFFALGREAGYMPLRGGVLVPYPLTGAVRLSTDALGEASVGYTMPPVVTSGATLYVQAWIYDRTAPYGLAASNAVEGVVP